MLLLACNVNNLGVEISVGLNYPRNTEINMRKMCAMYIRLRTLVVFAHSSTQWRGILVMRDSFNKYSSSPVKNLGTHSSVFLPSPDAIRA